MFQNVLTSREKGAYTFASCPPSCSMREMSSSTYYGRYKVRLRTNQAVAAVVFRLSVCVRTLFAMIPTPSRRRDHTGCTLV